MAGQLAVITDYVETLPRRTKIVAGGALVLVLVAAIAIAYFVRGDDAPVFAGTLDAQQISEVERGLTTMDIPFKVTTDNVMVEASKRRDIAMRLSMMGIPHTPLQTRSDALKNTSALTPDSQIAQGQQQGLEGEIADSLRGMTGILDAKVLIAAAQHGYFVNEASSDAKASVRLTLAPGTTLSVDKINNIRRYVANSVPGLQLENVSVLDGNEVDVSAVASSAAASNDLQDELQKMLDKSIGPDQTVVQVNVETEDASTSSHEVKSVPVSQNAISTDAEREHYVGKSKSYDKVRQNVNRGNDTTDTQTTTQPGGIKRQSVAIWVNASQSDKIPAIKAEVAALIVPGRDSLAVQAVNFPGMAGAAAPGAPAAAQPGAPQPAAPGQPSKPEESPAMFASIANFGTPIPIILLGIASLAAFALFGKSIYEQWKAERERANVSAKREAFDAFEPVRVYTSLREEPPHTAAAILASLPSPMTAAVLEYYPEEERREIVKRLARKVAPVVRDVSVQSGVRV